MGGYHHIGDKHSAHFQSHDLNGRGASVAVDDDEKGYLSQYS
jgi:hypothetical protein